MIGEKLKNLGIAAGLTGMLLAGAGCSKSSDNAAVKKAVSQQESFKGYKTEWLIYRGDYDGNGKEDTIALVNAKKGNHKYLSCFVLQGNGEDYIVTDSTILGDSTENGGGRITYISRNNVSFKDYTNDGVPDLVLKVGNKELVGPLVNRRLFWQTVQNRKEEIQDAPRYELGTKQAPKTEEEMLEDAKNF